MGCNNSLVVSENDLAVLKKSEKTANFMFWQNNLKHFKKMGYWYIKSNSRCNGLLQDMLNGLYLDLFLLSDKRYNYYTTSQKAFVQFVFLSFRYAPYGGLTYCEKYNKKILSSLAEYTNNDLSLDKAFSSDDENYNMYNFLAYNDDISIDNNINLCDIVSDILSKREFELFKLKFDGFNDNDICLKMDITFNTLKVYVDRIVKRLRKNNDIILNRLSACGFDISHYKALSPYNAKTDRVYKQNEFLRARGRMYAQKRREKKSVEILQTSRCKTQPSV